MKKVLVVCGLLIIISATSCSKLEEVTPIEEQVNFSFDENKSIESNGNIVITLVKGNANRVFNKSPKTVHISNLNGYLLMNGAGYVEVEVDQRLELNMNNGKVLNTQPVAMKELSIVGKNINTNLKNLTIDSLLKVGIFNDGDFHVTGKAKYLNVSAQNQAAFFGAALVASNCVAINHSARDMQLNVTKMLAVEILNSGNILYTGRPTVVRVDEVGQGKVFAR